MIVSNSIARLLNARCANLFVVSSGDHLHCVKGYTNKERDATWIMPDLWCAKLCVGWSQICE